MQTITHAQTSLDQSWAMSWPDASDDRLVQRIAPAANCTAHRFPLRRDTRAQRESVNSSDNMQSSVDLHWCVDPDILK